MASRSAEGDAPAVIFFKDLSMKDVGLVGGKNASLGEMYQQLQKLGVRVPNGFAVTIAAFKAGLSEKNLSQLHQVLDPLDKSSPDFVKKLSIAGRVCRDTVYKAGLTPRHAEEIAQAYRQLNDEYRADFRNRFVIDNVGISVAVRSSATAEDLPTASFAGQHDTYLNIEGETQLLDAVKRCMASLFTDRAISYRIDQGFDHFKVFLSVGVMKMVRSDIASSGVMFSIDTETGYQDSVFITSAFGLGENVVQGTVDPDEYYVHKPTFKTGSRAVLRRRIGRKQMTMVYSTGREPIKNVPTPDAKRQIFCLNDEQVLELADCAIKIEDHYSKARGTYCPMDIEWALDGIDHCLYIVQARPETVVSQKKPNSYEQYKIEGSTSKYNVVASGRAVGTKISTGTACLIHNARDLSKFRKGNILIADTTTPDWEPVMKMAAGIVTNRGGRTCHAAIVARELGIAAIVGTDNALSKCVDGATVTVSCCQGEIGYLFEGKVPFVATTIDLNRIVKPKSTKMMINLGNPDLAFALSFLPCDGVGLARMEFIISEYIKIHPMALIHPERVRNPRDIDKIKEAISLYPSGSDYMIRQLSEGIGTIGAAFYPRPVVVRLSDYKTNEYAQLIGGEAFEPKEENPMLGFRGASRYSHPNYEEGFALECKALARVRDEMGLKNVIIMVPFVRTTKEAQKVIEVMKKHGLARGQNGLKVYMMCEIPNNVIQIDEFLKSFDGISIGSNDLTQLTLGCDRDSMLVADLFDERDSGVQTMLKMAIEGAKRNNAYSGICGQAPSDYPEVAKFLIQLGIGSISLTPDSLVETILKISGNQNA